MVETLGNLSPTPDGIVEEVHSSQFQAVETLGNLSPTPEGVVVMQVGQWEKLYPDKSLFFSFFFLLVSQRGRQRAKVAFFRTA